MPGRLITFEGIDGAGKSTQARKAYYELQKRYAEVILLREPGGTPFGDTIRALLLAENRGEDKINYERLDFGPLAEFLLFAAARHELASKVVLPALERGCIVLLDRFIDSSVAYQGYGRGIDLEFINSVNQTATGGLKPDLTLLFDLPPDQASARLKRGLDRMESGGKWFLENVRRGYLCLADTEPERIRRLDATQPLESVSAMMMELIESIL